MRARLKKWFKSQQYLNLAFAISLVLLGCLTYLCYLQIRGSYTRQNEIIRSLDARIELERIYSELKGVESAYRGYMLTNDSVFLEPYTYSQVKIAKSIRTIRRHLEENNLDKKRFQKLDSLVNQRFRHLRTDIFLHNQGRRTLAESTAHKVEGMAMTEEIRSLLYLMIEQETTALHNRQYEQGPVTPISFAFIIAFSLVTLFITFYVVRRSEKRALLINDVLSHNQQIFNYSEKIGNMAHWYQDQNGVLSHSENYWKLLHGIQFSPGVAPQLYMNTIHRKDRPIIKELLKNPMKWNELNEVIIRLFVNKSDMHYYRLSSRVIYSDSGDKQVVGVICDITAEQRAKVSMERQYNELVHTNAELSSFNHIVSHDLQEPLRKIQMFVSRMDLDLMRSWNSSYADILERTRLAAARAQLLIDDLLSYTRLNRSDKKFEKVNLNVLVEHVKVDLQQLIEENKAQIICEELPEITSVPYQIEQIFLNLITNSIKYRKEEIAPLIKISSTIVKGSEISDWPNAVSNRSYYRITFKDNGIGFDQQYAEKIFVIFKRLHPREAFEGTGIGLAICKKMVENHKGHINAQGEAGIGAVFNLYFPAN